MIEGLKFKLMGLEVRDAAAARAAYHSWNYERLKKIEREFLFGSSKRADTGCLIGLSTQLSKADNQRIKMEAMAAFTKIDETHLLDIKDLNELGLDLDTQKNYEHIIRRLMSLSPPYNLLPETPFPKQYSLKTTC